MYDVGCGHFEIGRKILDEIEDDCGHDMWSDETADCLVWS
jgi:hypothetical protein